MTFLDTLLSLDKAATAAPWRLVPTDREISWSKYDMSPAPSKDGAQMVTIGNFRGGVTRAIDIVAADGTVVDSCAHSERVEGADDEDPSRAANSALYVALRNAAPRIAALVEFAQRLATDEYADLGTGTAADDARVLLAALDKGAE